MLIWGAMTIPIVFVLCLAFYFKRQILWWELLIPLAVSAVLIAVCKFSTEKVQTDDTEYWGGYVVKAQYYESWDEEVPCRHDKYEEREETYTDSDGNTQTRTVEVYVGKEHAYDVDDHPAEWHIVDSNGIDIDTNKEWFNYFCRKFGNRQFIDLHRDYHSKDGDEYVSNWQGSDETLESVTTTHHYENRVQASTSVFKFRKVDPKIYGLYNYPKVYDGFRCQSILGYNGPEKKEAEKVFGLLNAKLGRLKQVRVWVLIFTDKPIQAGYDQQDYWQGGNKNELVITIGINKSREVQWAHVFSWSEVESLKIETRDFINSQKELSLVGLDQWLYPQIDQRFVRKEFKDFSYLTVEPPGWMVVLTFVLTILANIGVSFWLVTNEYDEDETGGRYIKPRARWKIPADF